MRSREVLSAAYRSKVQRFCLGRVLEWEQEQQQQSRGEPSSQPTSLFLGLTEQVCGGRIVIIMSTSLMSFRVCDIDG